MTTTPRDLGRAEGNRGRTDEHGPCPRQAPRSGSSAILSTAVPSTAPKATRGHRDAEHGLVAPSHSFRRWKREVKQDPVLPQHCPQCCPCLQGGKKAQEITLGGEGGPRVPGTCDSWQGAAGTSQSCQAKTLGQDDQEVMPAGDEGCTCGTALGKGHGDLREGSNPLEGSKQKASGCQRACLSLSWETGPRFPPEPLCMAPPEPTPSRLLRPLTWGRHRTSRSSWSQGRRLSCRR